MAPTDRYRARKQPKQERSQQTRQWILQAAAHVFAERGYAGGTTNHIAERAGLSVGSVYQYFPNKDAILRALMDDHLDAGAQLLTDRIAAGLPPRLEDTLRLFVRTTIDHHLDNPRLHRVLFEEAPRAPSFLARLHEAENHLTALITHLFDHYPEVQTPNPA
ncbi:TetR/AcrR family transcriptional regulator, partial [Nocardia sp. JMUB6875]|uniref:TetR/AcrR family transcriptional regulator n=1 Tax=Nocardia sp. JMUB6875 TaxID=3158170 RepID=UPI0034E86674